jgi:hypothetical protein
MSNVGKATGSVDVRGPTATTRGIDFSSPLATYETLKRAAAKNDLETFKAGLTPNMLALLGGEVAAYMIQFLGEPYRQGNFDANLYSTPSLGKQVSPTEPIINAKEGDVVQMESVPHPETLKRIEHEVGNDPHEVAKLTAEYAKPETFVFQKGGWRLDYVVD